MPVHALLSALVGTSLLFGGASTSEAQDPPVDAPRAVPVDVRTIVFARDPARWAMSAEDLQTSLAGNLGDLEIGVAVEALEPGGNVFTYLAWARSRAEDEEELAVFWLVPSGPDRADLYLLPPNSELGYVRALELPADPVERAEALAVVVRATAQSMREGNLGGMRTVELDAPEDPSSAGEGEGDPTGGEGGSENPPPPPEKAAHVRFGLGYEGGSLARSATWQSGLSGEVGVRTRIGVVAGIHAGWMTGPSDEPLVALRVSRVPIGGHVGYQLLADRRVSVAVQAMARAERIGWEITNASGPAVEGSTGAYWRFGLGPELSLMVRLVAGLGAHVTAAGVFWVTDQDLAVQTPAGREVVLQPDLGSFRFGVGLHYEF